MFLVSGNLRLPGKFNFSIDFPVFPIITVPFVVDFCNIPKYGKNKLQFVYI